MKRIVWLLLLCLLLSIFGGCAKPEQTGSVQLPGQTAPAAPADLPEPAAPAAGPDTFHLEYTRTALPGSLKTAAVGTVISAIRCCSAGWNRTVRRCMPVRRTVKRPPFPCPRRRTIYMRCVRIARAASGCCAA